MRGVDLKRDTNDCTMAHPPLCHLLGLQLLVDDFPNEVAGTSLNRFDALDSSLQLDELAQPEGVAVILEFGDQKLSPLANNRMKVWRNGVTET